MQTVIDKSFIFLLMIVFLINFIHYYPSFAVGNDRGDALFHYSRMVGTCDQQYFGRESCRTYPPLYHAIGSLFVKSSQDFLNFNIIVFLLIGCLTIYYFTKSIWSIPFFLTATNLPQFVLSNAVLPSFLSIMAFLVIIKTKSIRLKLLMIGIGLLLHNYFFVLVVLWGVALILSKAYNGGFFALIPPFYPFSFLKETSGAIDYWLSSNPFFVSAIGFLNLLKEKKIELLLIVVFSFLTSFDILRSFMVAQLLTLAGFVWYFEKQPQVNRELYCLAIILFNALSWV